MQIKVVDDRMKSESAKSKPRSGVSMAVSILVLMTVCCLYLVYHEYNWHKSVSFLKSMVFALK